MNRLPGFSSLALCAALTLLPACSALQPSQQQAQVAADIHRHTAILAADKFEGRAPGTQGEELSVQYISEQFAALGLQPGNNGSWFQDVPITAVTTDPSAVLKIAGSDFQRDLVYGADMMAATERQLASVEVNASPLVFVGYGINAPERGWNDYAGLDVRGKTVVVLINDPGFATQDPALFNGNAMTYYGRWTYKYEEASRQGAAAVLIVHETAPAAYPWEVVRNSWSGPQIGLTNANQYRDKVAVEAWITHEAAQELFSAAGLDYTAMKMAAVKPGFRAVAMGDLTASIALHNTLHSSKSRNVIARLPGTTWPGETVVYSAHWDHLGKREGEAGDNIYNGASDNAAGVADLLALAHLHVQQGPARRSVVFLAVTAEESGLLGSKWYAGHPVYPLATTVADLNIDNPYKGVDGRMRDVAVVGYGNSELDDYLAAQAETQGRVVVQEPNPEKGSYYRSDHFNFAAQGVPALYTTRSTDSREHGKAWGQRQLDAFVSNIYHKPGDEYSPDWDVTGMVEDVQLFYGVGRTLADSHDWPNWRPGTEFRARRDASEGERRP